MSKDLFSELSQKAYSHSLLHHYTKLDTLKKILANSSLMLNRLDLVNDSNENSRITSLWNDKVFVTCFTNTLSNEEYFFENYGTVRTSIKPCDLIFDVFSDSKLKTPLKNFKSGCNSRSVLAHKSYNNTSDWCVYDTCLADVCYTDDSCNHLSEDGYESNAGLIKNRCGYNNKKGKLEKWEFESETRIRVAVRPIGTEYCFNSKSNSFEYYKPNFSKLYIPLPKNLISIAISPKCKEEEKEEFNIIKKDLFQKNILINE